MFETFLTAQAVLNAESLFSELMSANVAWSSFMFLTPVIFLPNIHCYTCSPDFCLCNLENSNSSFGGSTPFHWSDFAFQKSQCCCCSVTQSCPTFCNPMDCSMIRPPCSSQSPVVCPSLCPLHLWCYPFVSSSDALFSFSPQSFLAPGLFQWVGCLLQVSKILALQLHHQSFQWVLRVDVLRIDWFDLLAVQGTPRSLLQHHSSKASILWCSAFFMVQLSQSYVTTGKTIALTIWTFVGRVMALLSNTLSSLVIVFLLRSSCLLILWLWSPSAVILEPKKRKSVTHSTFSPSSCHEVVGLDTMILVFLTFSFKLALSLPSFTLIKRLFSSSPLAAIRVVLRLLSQ